MPKKSLVAVLLAALIAAPAAARAEAPAAPLDLTLTHGDSSALAQIAGTSDSGTGTIFTSALYGGLAGAVVGAGVGLIENGKYGRDIAIGAGAGILIGAVLGAAHAFHDTRAFPATDGLNTTERYPVMQGHTMGLSGRF